MDFLLTYGLGRMKHFSFVYFSMLLHDSEEGCSHFVFEGLISHGEERRFVTFISQFVTSDYKDVRRHRAPFCRAEGSSTVD